LPSRDIFRDSNDKKSFISVDMRKANFSSLYHYDPSIFGGADFWEEFLGRHTTNQHILSSKYVRQVIFGNCNPKRHITYEKFLMDNVLQSLNNELSILDRFVFFSNDEIVLGVSDLTAGDRKSLAEHIDSIVANLKIPLKTEMFTLHKITGTNGYYKKIDCGNGVFKTELKCLDNFYMPFVLRCFNGEEITENDKVFLHQGSLSKFIEVPKIELALDAE